MSNTSSASETIPTKEFLGHPIGLYICFTTELWERFSFYGMKYLLLLYLTKYHLFSDAAGLDVLGSYAGLVYALPLIGGIVADRFLGMRKSVVFGGIMLCIGHLLMAVEGHQAVNYAAGTILSNDLTLDSGKVLVAGTLLSETVTFRDTAALNVFYLALAFIVLGVGYLKPNISTIVGKLYEDNDPRRDSGFTIFYMGINTGSFVATLFCGWLGETYGWGYGFGAAGIGMLFGLCTFLLGQKHLMGHAEPTDPEKLKKPLLGPINTEWSIYLLSLPFLVVFWLLVQHEPVVLLTQNVFLIIAVVGLILNGMVHNRTANNTPAYVFAAIAVIAGLFAVASNFGLIPSSPEIAEYSVYASTIIIIGFVAYGFMKFYSPEFARTFVLMILILSSIVFWALFEQSAGSMTLFADRSVDRNIFNFEFSASQFGSLNALFIMILAIPFAAVWAFLGKRGIDPNPVIKFGFGNILAGLGFGALVVGAGMVDSLGKVAAIWLILAYLLHTMGELCLSPVGLSAVTKLSIPNVVSVSMGTWFLATSLSETIATRLGRMASIETPVNGVADTASTLATYTSLYEYLMWLGIGAGLLLIALSPLLKKHLHGTN